jgi:aminoglycoside N3'-acetyltransferase
MAAGNAGEKGPLPVQPNNQLKKLRKRPRVEQDRRNVDFNLEALRSLTKVVRRLDVFMQGAFGRLKCKIEQQYQSMWKNLKVLMCQMMIVQGVESTVEKLQSALADREAEVTVREVASISAEARLAQKSAYLEAYETRLREWDARMRTKEAALQQWQAGLQVGLGAL